MTSRPSKIKAGFCVALGFRVRGRVRGRVRSRVGGRVRSRVGGRVGGQGRG